MRLSVAVYHSNVHAFNNECEVCEFAWLKCRSVPRYEYTDNSAMWRGQLRTVLQTEWSRGRPIICSFDNVMTWSGLSGSRLLHVTRYRRWWGSSHHAAISSQSKDTAVTLYNMTFHGWPWPSLAIEPQEPGSQRLSAMPTQLACLPPWRICEWQKINVSLIVEFTVTDARRPLSSHGRPEGNRRTRSARWISQLACVHALNTNVAIIVIL